MEQAFKAKGMRQAAAADMLGVGKTTFNKWVTGHTHPSTEAAWGALVSLGISREDLSIYELLDKIEALRIDLGVSKRDMSQIVTAVEIAEASGESVADVIRRMQRLGGASAHVH